MFRRARWRCQACGRGGALEVHHVVKRGQGGSVALLDEEPRSATVTADEEFVCYVLDDARFRALPPTSIHRSRSSP